MPLTGSQLHDFESGEGGDIFDLIQTIEGLTFAEALDWAESVGGLSGLRARADANLAGNRLHVFGFGTDAVGVSRECPNNAPSSPLALFCRMTSTFSFPLRSDGNGGYEVVQGLEFSDFAKEKVAATEQELNDEREIVKDLL